MLELDTFLTELYVTVDEIVKTLPPAAPRPGPAPALSASEVITLALLAQWRRFANERDFYRWATRHLRAAFPTLPQRSQFNRLVRAQHDALVAVGQRLADRVDGQACAYEIVDGTAVPVRNAKRRGSGWLAGQAAIGRSNRLGWYEGLLLLLSVTPRGAITGSGLVPANTKEQVAAETFFAVRHTPHPDLPSVGRPGPVGSYMADGGFEGQAAHRRWLHAYDAVVSCPPHRTKTRGWSAERKRWWASLRQIIETVNAKLHDCFRLEDERPHTLRGLQARIAAKIALHNFCLWLNPQLDRAPLAFADLIAW